MLGGRGQQTTKDTKGTKGTKRGEGSGGRGRVSGGRGQVLGQGIDPPTGGVGVSLPLFAALRVLRVLRVLRGV